MKLLQMSLAGGVMILVITVIRALAIERLPKKTFLALWAAALVRLLAPVSLPSALSIYSLLARRVPAAAEWTAVPALPALPAETGAAAAAQQTASAPAAQPPVWTIVWAVGAAVFAAAYGRCCREFRASFPVENDVIRRWLQSHPLRRTIAIRQSGRISSPLTFGVLRPVILMPKKTDWTDETALRYVLEHEFVHIQRFDVLSKLLLIAAVCVHWFNPLVWAAFILAGKDMEMSCDEAVVRELGEDIRADYSASLLSLATGRRIVAGMPLAFGEGDTGSRIRNLLNWKRPQPWIIAVCAVVCVGLIALCAANPKGSGTPTEDPPADRTETGQWASVEAYVQQVMLSQTEARYYAENADGTVSDQPHTAAVTDRKLEYLTKGGELAGLDPDGVLEEWEYFYLVKLDVDTASVALVGGQYYDDEEYFSLDDRHVMVALRHDDGNYDILCDDSINDGGDFFGYHNTMEEAIYDWYVTDRKLDLPLYVEDWIDQINYNNPNDKPGNYPVHRYDVDGGYLYIPGSAWIMADVTAHRSHGHWEWYSGYDTGSILTVDRFTQTLEDEYITSRKQGFEPLDDTKQIWKRRQGGINERYYFYPAADGNGCWRIWTLWTDLGISNYVHIFIEPQVMYLMAESFTPTESFPAAGASTRTTMASTYRAEVDGRAADLTVSYTVEQKNGELQLCSLDSARARNVHGWEQVHLAATVEQHQSLFGSGLYQYLVPVFYEADRGNGWETFQAVV